MVVGIRTDPSALKGTSPDSGEDEYEIHPQQLKQKSGFCGGNFVINKVAGPQFADANEELAI